MRLVQRLLLVTFIVFMPLLPVVILSAQGPPMMGGMPPQSINVKKFEAIRELTRLTKKYKLTVEQKSAILPILTTQEKKVHELGEEEGLSDADWVAAVRQTHQQTVAKVKLQMTDEQAGKYVVDEEKQAKSDAEDDQMQGPMGPPGGGGLRRGVGRRGLELGMRRPLLAESC